MSHPEIVPNAFLDNLGSDWVAIDQNGHPVCRAATREAVERAVPHAAAFVTGADLEKIVPAPEGLSLESIGAALPPEDIKAMAAVEETPPKAPLPKNASRRAPADGSAFDHDGDGKVGGSRPKAKKAAPKAAKTSK